MRKKDGVILRLNKKTTKKAVWEIIKPKLKKKCDEIAADAQKHYEEGHVTVREGTNSKGMPTCMIVVASEGSIYEEAEYGELLNSVILSGLDVTPSPISDMDNHKNGGGWYHHK